MIIDINQAQIALADKYRIYIDEQLEADYRAARRLWRIFAEVDLFRGNDPDPRLTIKKQFAPFMASYEIRRGGDRYRFSTRSFWKHRYQCNAGADAYTVYGHRGRKYSIFKNDVQVGWWNKEAISWFAGDNYRIICDDDTDIELLIAFCLIIDNYRNDDHDGSTFNYDFGNLVQAKKFDTAWQPRARK